MKRIVSFITIFERIILEISNDVSIADLSGYFEVAGSIGVSDVFGAVDLIHVVNVWHVMHVWIGLWRS